MTALRATANKYVQGQALGGGLPDRPFGFPLNPVSRLINPTTRSWNDANRNFTPDCDLTSALANGECGAYPSSRSPAQTTEIGGKVPNFAASIIL